jgi:hypothetical protein
MSDRQTKVYEGEANVGIDRSPRVPAHSESAAAPTASEAEVKAAVERLLELVGRYDFDALSAMMAPAANVASVVLRDGRWVSASSSFEAWAGEQQGAREPYEETASRHTVHIDDDRLAFVRSEATLVQGGRVRSHNTDYFTLIRDASGEWKFVNCSYTAKRADAHR